MEELRATIVFEPEFRNADALRGIEGFSHLWLIWQFSEAVRTQWSPTVRPPRLGGNTRMRNQTWSLDEYKFSLMGYGEFAADRYLTLHARWNAGGLLFNLIPWVNRLNLREMFSLKMAYGALSPRHADVLTLPEGMHAPHTPYIEVGAGIGNILRVLNVESVWRLTHRKHTHMPLWGIRFSLALGM